MKGRNEMIPGLSRSGIDRAGEVIRARIAGEMPDADELDEALGVMIQFRETFQAPLNKVAMGLRSMVGTEVPSIGTGGPVPVSQRLKRQIQMAVKLHRFPRMKLSRMGDVGGCRAVLPTSQEVDGVVWRIRKNWDRHGKLKVRDFREVPAPSGYRAVHVMTERDGRTIEVQLRDQVEHSWAVAVERTGQRLGLQLKEGQGPDDLRHYFRLASYGLYLDNHGLPTPPEFSAEFEASREQVRRYFER